MQCLDEGQTATKGISLAVIIQEITQPLTVTKACKNHATALGSTATNRLILLLNFIHGQNSPHCCTSHMARKAILVSPLSGIGDGYNKYFCCVCYHLNHQNTCRLSAFSGLSEMNAHSAPEKGLTRVTIAIALLNTL